MLPDLASLALLGGWLYVVAFAATALDAVVPLVPSEAVLIAGGVLAASGQTDPVGLALAGAAGGVAGDCTAYLLGARLSSGGLGPLLHRRRGQALLRWATLELVRHGPVIIVAARFVPGGRTAATLTAGFLRYPVPPFAGSVIAGGVLWGAYATALGYAGGRAFHSNGWLALGAALVAAVTVAMLAGLGRRLFGRRRPPLPAAVPARATRRAA